MKRDSFEIADSTDPKIRKALDSGSKRVILPIGSIEQHGAHLPVSTDAMIAHQIAKLISKRVKAFILPPLFYGVSQEHRPLFNVSLSNETMASVIMDICTSLAENGFNRIILLNGHYGNEAVLSLVSKEVHFKLPPDVLVYALSYWTVMEEEIGHADEIETSLLLAIKQELVNMDKAQKGSPKIGGARRDPRRKKLVWTRLTALPSSIPSISKNGVLGDPTKATRKRGQILLDEVSRRLADAIKDIENACGELQRRK